MASAIHQRSSLNSFSVRNFIEAIETNKVTSYFVDSLGSLKGLTCLDLSFSCISDYLLCSLALDTLPLTKLVLHGCFDYTYYGIYRLLSKSPFLQHLYLQDAMFLNDQHINELCAFLGDLVSINVNGCDKLTNAAFFALLRNCPLLSEIHMESTQLGIGSRSSLDLVVLVFPPVQRTGEQRFFVASTNYYSERTNKIQTYNAVVRQIGLCCHHKIKDVIVWRIVQFNLKQLHIPDQ